MRRYWLVAWMVFCGLVSAAYGQQEPIIAAAAGLKLVLPELLDAFERQGGGPVQVAYGSSGHLVRQIVQRAPFELFLAADEASIEELVRRGVVADTGVVYAHGQLVFCVPAGSAVVLGPEGTGLVQAVRAGTVRRLALANPEHAPYGLRAREVLERLGIWEELEAGRRMVVGEDTTQALQFILSGGAEAGLIPLSLVVAPAVSRRVAWQPIPTDWHAPLKQRMVLLPGATPTTRALWAFLLSPAGQAVLQRYGFDVPRGGGM